MGLFDLFKSKDRIKEAVISEMVKIEIQIHKDSLKNKWTKKEESHIFKERILNNKLIQKNNKHFTKEELAEVLLPEVQRRIDIINSSQEIYSHKI